MFEGNDGRIIDSRGNWGVIRIEGMLEGLRGGGVRKGACGNVGWILCLLDGIAQGRRNLLRGNQSQT